MNVSHVCKIKHVDVCAVAADIVSVCNFTLQEVDDHNSETATQISVSVFDKYFVDGLVAYDVAPVNVIHVVYFPVNQQIQVGIGISYQQCVVLVAVPDTCDAYVGQVVYFGIDIYQSRGLVVGKKAEFRCGIYVSVVVGRHRSHCIVWEMTAPVAYTYCLLCGGCEKYC